MIKSKIPLPSKRSAQSSIPLPTKSLGTQSKKLPLNSKEILVSKKPVSTKQVPPISSKVGGEKEKNIVKRLPPSKSCDSKKVAVVSKKPPFNDKKVANARNKLTENKLIKQTKPVPVRPPKTIISKPRSVSNKENHPKRLSTLKSHNGKTAVSSNNEPNTVKTTNQSKVVNQAKHLNKISTNGLKENSNKNPLVKKKEEKVAVVLPFKQINLATKSGVDDSEFQKSGFFKSLILNEHELSPGIIKYCSEAEFSPSKANLLQPPQKVYPRFLTADEFVEEVKRVSSKYYRLNGRLVLHSPHTLKQQGKTADEIVEEVKRISERYRQGNGNCIHSPILTPKNTFQRMAKNTFSVKKNFDEARRLSEFRTQTSLNADVLMANRRWTCNASSKPIANMNATEIAAELRRISEIRRESGAQLYKKATFVDHQFSVEKLNPAQKALKELEFLTAKKKDKTKKKVTFLIPFPGSPDLTTSTSTKPEAKLSDISEGSSHTSTPELDLGNARIMTNSESGDSVGNAEDTSVITTPELNLTTYKLDFDLASKKLNETLPFDLSPKNDASINNESSNNQALSLEAVKDVSKKNSVQDSQNISLSSTNLKSDFISSKFSSLKIKENNFCAALDIPDSNSSSFKNYMTDTNSNSYSEFSNVKSTDCLFQSVHRLAVPTYQPVNETEKFCVNTVNETEKFCVNTEKKIYTPHPVKLHSKSNSPASPFLSSNLTTLNSTAPIHTPFVLRTLSHSPEVSLNTVRQRLDFNERPNNFMERRESQIILQSIPTAQKMNDFLCDQECIILSSQSSEEEVFFRNLMNPIAYTLYNGDEMHFIPISSP